MCDDSFPKYFVLKCLNNEELNAVRTLSTALPTIQVKVTTDLTELAKDTFFTEVVSSDEISIINKEVVDPPTMTMDESSQDTYEMSGPEPKRTKLSFDVFNYSTDEDKPYDRILMVENAKFYIQSDKLIKHSGYFRSLFTSDFKEKEQEIISLKVFDAEKIKLFMDAVYRPESFDITEDNLEMMVKLFGFFEAVYFLIELFKEKKVFESIAADKLLDLANKFGLNELKNAIEEFLIEQINSKYLNMPLRPICELNTQRQYFYFEEPVCSSLKISEKYQLKQLQDCIDAHIAFEFTRNVPVSTGRLPYTYLPDLYPLVKLTKSVENYAISIVDEQALDVIDTYLKQCTSKVEMCDLKKAAGESLLKQFKNDPPTRVHSYEKYLKMVQYCDADELKKKISSRLEPILNENDGSSLISHKDIRKMAFEYNLEPIKSRQEELFIIEFNEKHQPGNTWDNLSSYDLPNLKEVVEEYLVKKFTGNEKDDDLMKEMCMFSRTCKMEKLKSLVETYIVDEFHSNHNFKYLIYAWDCEMEKCKNVFTEFFKRNITVKPIITASREYFVDLPDDEEQYEGLQNFILCSIISHSDKNVNDSDS